MKRALSEMNAKKHNKENSSIANFFCDLKKNRSVDSKKSFLHPIFECLISL